MARPAGDDVDNVVPLRGSYRPYHAESRAHVRDMVDAVRSFEQLERCAAMLQSGPLAIAREIDGAEWPIVSFQVELPVIHQWLDRLGSVNVVTWPDTHWALRLGNARSAAVLGLHAVQRSMHRCPPGTGPLDGRLAADIRKLADALRRLRQLIAEQCPEALCAP
jgi:hypothetical protein